jgi:RNA methyltransferase, TrmH family
MDSRIINIDEIQRCFCDFPVLGFKAPLIKEISDLIRNKKTDQGDLFVIEGLWAYEKIIKSNITIKTFAFSIESIKNTTTYNMVRHISGIAESSYTISSKVCSRLSTRDDSEGFFMICRLPEYKLEDISLGDNNLIVILEGLENAGNIGTIIRSADGAGAHAVILCNSKVSLTNSKVIKSSMGSGFMMPVLEVEKQYLFSWLKKNGFKVILTDLKAQKTYFNQDYRGRIAIVAGNEVHGVCNDWYDHNCEKVIIPMLGGADSLNVGVAATVVIYEASLRQKDIIIRSS